MGGIIEDKIIEILQSGKLTVREVKDRLPRFGQRAYGTLDYHLRKMWRVQILNRERDPSGTYRYSLR